MRVVLETGRQSELIAAHKSRYGYTWDQLASSLGVSKYALISWGREETLLPYQIFKSLDEEDSYSCYILEKKPEGWGKIKGGLNSTGATKWIKFPKKSSKLAEFVGIVLGDGNINAYRRGKKVATYSVNIVGDSRNDRDYLVNFVGPLAKRLFGVDPKFYPSKLANALRLTLHSKNLVRFMIGLGLKSGNKVKNQVGVPLWIWEKQSYIKACLRGLIDTDGCVHNMGPRWPHLAQLSFENFSLPLLLAVQRAFLILGLHPSRIHGTKTVYGNRVLISRKADIRKFYKVVGFNNPKHALRYKNIAPSSRPAKS